MYGSLVYCSYCCFLPLEMNSFQYGGKLKLPHSMNAQGGVGEVSMMDRCFLLHPHASSAPGGPSAVGEDSQGFRVCVSLLLPLQCT